MESHTNEEEAASDEENEERLMSRALPVAKLSKGADLSVPPATGEEYLSRVRLEASKNLVVVADVDVKKYEQKRTPQYFQPKTIAEDRKEFKASLDWQNEQVAQFTSLSNRSKLERENFLKEKKTKIELPSLKKKNEWFLYCLGKAKRSSKQPKEPVEPHKPLLTLLFHFDQATVVQVIDYLVEWVEEFGYSNEAFEWIYSLMCFLEKPLLPETCSSLRNLARKSIELRAKLNDLEDEQLTPLNLIITLVGRYFNQLDLADD